MQFTLKALLGLLATVSLASAVSFDMEYVGPEKRGISGEELHKLHGEQFQARVAKGVYLGVGNETNIDKRGKSSNVDLDDKSGHAWLVKAKVGSEGEEVRMMLDSGYEHALIAADSYSPKKSSTSENTGEDFNAAFMTGGGNRGTIYKDDVSVGGLKASGLAFGYTKERDFSNDQNIGGMLGMALSGHQESAPAFARHGWNGFLKTLEDQGVIDEAKYQMTLKSDGGKLAIGEVDDSQYEGDLETVPNTGLQYGHCGFQGTLNGKKHNFLLDSGTAGIGGSYNSIKKFLQGISGVELVENEKDGSVSGKIDCDKLPDVKITVADKFDIKIPEDSLKLYEMGGGKCMLPFFGYTNIPMSYDYNWIAGGTIMKQVSVVCTFGSNKMQIAKQKSD